MDTIVEIRTKEDFETILDDYNEIMKIKFGKRGTMAGDQLIRQLSISNHYVIGIKVENEPLNNFVFLRRDKDLDTMGYIDLIFQKDLSSEKLFKKIVLNTLNYLKGKKIFQISYNSPNFNTFDIDDTLLNLKFKKAEQYRLELDVTQFKKIDTKIDDDFIVHNFDESYIAKIAEMVIESFKGTIDTIVFSRYKSSEIYSKKLEHFLKGKRQQIIQSASPIILKDNQIVGYYLTVPISHNHALIWEGCVKKEYRGKLVAKFLMEKSLLNLLLNGYTKASFATTSKGVADYCTTEFPIKSKLVNISSLFHINLE